MGKKNVDLPAFVNKNFTDAEFHHTFQCKCLSLILRTIFSRSVPSPISFLDLAILSQLKHPSSGLSVSQTQTRDQFEPDRTTEEGETELQGTVIYIPSSRSVLLRLQCVHKSSTDLAKMQILAQSLISGMGPGILSF